MPVVPAPSAIQPTDLDPVWIVAIVALVIVQLSLQVAAVVDIVRKRGPWGIRKIVWLVVAVAGEMVGAIVYFAFGRRMLAEVPTESAPAADVSKAADAVDALYGSKEPPAGDA